jgi:hypothetical protein
MALGWRPQVTRGPQSTGFDEGAASIGRKAPTMIVAPPVDGRTCHYSHNPSKRQQLNSDAPGDTGRL